MAKINAVLGGAPDLCKLFDSIVEGAGYWRKRTFWFDALPYMGKNPTDRQKELYENKQRYLSRLEYFDRTEVFKGEWNRGIRKTTSRRGNQSTFRNRLMFFCRSRLSRPSSRATCASSFSSRG